MRRATIIDISLTKSYMPKVSKIPDISPTIAKFYKSIENRNIHEGSYSTDLPTPDDIRRLLELERFMIDRTIKSQTVTLTPNQILTKELSPDMKQWEELIRENLFRLGGHRDHLPACLAHIANPTANLPYGMFLTRLYRHIMKAYPYLDNGIYDIVDRARHSVSSLSSHRQGTSSRQHDDDDDVETSRANDTKTPSPKLLISSPSASNAPSKTPSTKDTSSSSIDYIPKSPTSSTSLSPNGYLNSPTSPPPRVSPPPPTQENASMDITLTLSSITPLDVQFDTPSPSPPIIEHPIP
ncbi:hypothetical protein Tco_1492219 [Tanacetum coccineum]